MTAPTTSPNGQGPVTVLAPLSFGARLRDLADARNEKRLTTVTLPKATEEMGQPVTFQVRAMTLKEQRRSGLMPDPLAERIRAFQDALMYYAAEKGLNKGNETPDIERTAMLSYLREEGAQEFEDTNDAIRDAAVICCCVEPRVVLEPDFVADIEHEVALEWIAESDRSVLQAAIAKLTGDLAMSEIKSDLAERADSTGSDAEAAPAGDGLRETAERVAGTGRPRRHAR